MLSPNMGFRRRALFALMLLSILSAFPPTAFAIEVDKAELEKGGTQKIVFINYEGPHARIDTSEDILGIGLALGKAIRDGASRAGDERRYYAVHSAGGSAGDPKFAADMIGLGVDAGVDHIKNLRLILRGFLQAAYDYSPKDAAVLAEFATVYNAVHRGDWNYYADRYRDAVVGSLSKDKAGLSVRFDEWPGRAQIVIPLSEGAAAGSLSAVDTTPLTEKGVVDQMRKDEGKGVDTRKDMVDLKEREADQARQTATLDRQAIVDEEKKIADEKAAIAAEKERIAAEEKKAEEAKKTAQPSGTQPAAGQAGPASEAQPAGAAAAAPEQTAEQKKAEEKIAADKKAVEEREAAVAEKEKAVEQKKEEAQQAEAFADKKDAEASADRAEIAKDQQEQIKKDAAAVAAAEPVGALALKMVSADGPYARFVMVDKSTGKELKASPLDTVYARSTAEIGGMIIAVAGKEGGNGAVRLVALDDKTLEMTKQGDVDIQQDSPLWVVGENIYAMIKGDGGPRLARFGSDLTLKAKSSEPVHPYAVPFFAPGTVLVPGKDGAVMILREADLSR